MVARARHYPALHHRDPGFRLGLVAGLAEAGTVTTRSNARTSGVNLELLAVGASEAAPGPSGTIHFATVPKYSKARNGQGINDLLPDRRVLICCAEIRAVSRPHYVSSSG